MQSESRILVFVLIVLVLDSGFSNTDQIANRLALQSQGATTNTRILGGEVDIKQQSGAFEGYNLFVVVKEEMPARNRQYMMMIVDMGGNVLLEEEIDADSFLADHPAEFIDPRTILVATNDSASLFNLTSGSMTLLPFNGHHDFEYNPINDTFFTLRYTIKTVDLQTYLYDRIVEYNREGDTVWSFPVSSIVDTDMWCPYREYYSGFPDVSHSNTVYYDAEDDAIYLMTRNANTFWKINHSNGEAIWGLGQYGDFNLFNKWGKPTDTLFYHAHAVERIDDNKFILFDNDYHNQTDEIDRNSRIIEITIDEDTMTANTSWVWEPGVEYYSYVWGDADRLPNGDRLGVFGVGSRLTSEYGARLVEVNAEHDILWELSFVSNETYRYGIYRNERFQFQPFIQVLEVRNTNTEGSVIIDWQTAYNYRPKRDISGTYEFYVDDVLLDEGEVTFDRYWRPTVFSHSIENLTLGIHNVTIVVWDGFGHASTLMTDIEINLFSIFQVSLFMIATAGIIALVIIWRRYIRN
ncbi:MAG: aryl-sulfate sulfotransferase [Candidatus Thorarchaeota archaeon]